LDADGTDDISVSQDVVEYQQVVALIVMARLPDRWYGQAILFILVHICGENSSVLVID
jgi:hypothetical protein